MHKSTIIAQCLVNSKMKDNIQEAEHEVRRIFMDEFPEDDFEIWNVDISEATGNVMIDRVGKASQINVKKFIENLS